jgi:hypothetical protein
MKIIGLTGAAGAGKDTTADTLCELVPGATRFAFADALREEIARAFGIDARALANPYTKQTRSERLALRHCTDAGFVSYAWELADLPGLMPRTAMQRWGDYRRAQDPDYFILPALRARLRAVEEQSPLLIVTDVRFPNEAAWLRRVGGELWRIVRPGVAAGRHISDVALQGEIADQLILNDDGFEHLRRIVVDLLTSHAGQ